MKMQKYPVGMQSFSEIRERGFVYVDKTRYILKLMDYGKYFFLGRPRRFGKSLFISTLKAFYQGRRELFDGLAIASCEHDWKLAPVLHLDFTGADYTEKDSLDNVLELMLRDWEKTYGVEETEPAFASRFQHVIARACEHTGQKVVILIDEYDKPLIDTIEMPELQDKYRNQLRGIYGNLKKMDEYISMAFMTGITHFGKLNIFSDLNNLKDISLLREFGAICGITDDELHDNFHAGVEAFAKEESCTVNEMYNLLRQNYDGYHFSTTGCPDIYNPFSLLNAMQDKSLGRYWFATGTPQFLVKRIKSRGFRLEKINRIQVALSDIENMPPDMKGDPIPILYQSGYLTIKDYDKSTRRVTLGFPNREVEQGFLEQLLIGQAKSRSAI